MIKCTFDEIKDMLHESIKKHIEAELSLFIGGKKYMIIIFDDRCSFQRCGAYDGSGEYYYKTLDELYNAQQVDGIILSRDWNKIEALESFELQLYVYDQRKD